MSKVSLNLSINDEILEFGKQWSYVTGISLSKMFEQFLIGQKRLISRKTPDEWLTDPEINPFLEYSEIKEEIKAYEEFLNNKNEAEFCRKQPDHPRAILRKKLVLEKSKAEERLSSQIEKDKEQFEQKRREFEKRWKEVFNKS